jgi:hypothetical protein
MRWPLLLLLMGLTACGRSDVDVPPEPAAHASQMDATSLDAGLLDAGRDASVRRADAVASQDAEQRADRAIVADAHTAVDHAIIDSHLLPDVARTSDAGHDAPTSMDAAEGRDAGEDAEDAHAEAKAKDAGRPHAPCDQCDTGDQECAPVPGVCKDDAGFVVSCTTAIWTCVLGDAGCAVWAEPAACRSDVPCCVPCEYEFDCPLGSIGTVCEQDTDCAFNSCNALTHVCNSSQCGDHREDGSETDIDCGGFICNPCQRGQGCQANYDCIGGSFCNSSHVCQ